MAISLYNYMEFKHLRSWLTNGIFFGLASNFNDRNEGFLPQKSIDSLKEEIAKFLSNKSLNLVEVIDRVGQLTADMAEVSRRSTFISCWHENVRFSPKMAEGYANNGVYIKTSPESISFAVFNREIFKLLQEPDGKDDPIFQVVRYIKDIRSPDRTTAINDLLALAFHRNKDMKKWAGEREWRLVIEASKLAVLTGMAINGSVTVNGADDLRIDNSGLSLGPVNKETGLVEFLYTHAEPSIFVQEIGVLSHENFDEVVALCEEFKLRPPRLIEESEWLEDVPIDSMQGNGA